MPASLHLPALIVAEPAFNRRRALSSALTAGPLPIPLPDDLKEELDAAIKEIVTDETRPRRVRAHAAVACLISMMLSEGESIHDEKAEADPSQYDDPEMADFMSKHFSKLAADTLKGVDLYLDFAPQAARDAWMYGDGDGEEMARTVLETLREQEEGQTWAEENGDDDKADDGDDDKADDGGLKVKLPTELTEYEPFETWVEDYTPLGVKCPIPKSTAEGIAVVAIGFLSVEEEASRLKRAAVVAGLLTSNALCDSESRSSCLS